MIADFYYGSVTWDERIDITLGYMSDPGSAIQWAFCFWRGEM
jgi:hypothetical protein